MKRILSIVLAVSLLCSVSVWASDDKLGDMLAKAVDFMQAEDYESAEICYDIAMKLSPDDPNVLAQAAWMYAWKGDKNQAQALIEEAIDLAPAEGALYIVKAKIMFMHEMFEETILAIRYADICGTDMDKEFCIEVAVSCFYNGFYAEAVELFELVEQEFWWEKYSKEYGRALTRSGEHERAKQLGLVKCGVKEVALANAMQNEQEIQLSVWKEDLSEYPVYFSADYYEANKEAVSGELEERITVVGNKARLSEKLSELDEVEVNILAVSPSGEVILYGFGSTLVIEKNNELVLVTPGSNTAGQENEELPPTYAESFYFGELIEQDSVAWSPDEKYFTLTFSERAVLQGRLYDLVLVDTETGVLSAVEITPKKFGEEGFQTAISACFDEKGKEIYYLVYGDIGEGSRCGLKRYHIDTGICELLCEVQDVLTCYAGIYMDYEGYIRSIADRHQIEEPGGTIVFSENENGWEYQIHDFSNPLKYQRPRRYLYSDNSLMEIVLNNNPETSAVNWGLYMCLNTDVLSGQADDQAVLLPKEGTTAEIKGIMDAVPASYEVIDSEFGKEGVVPISPWLSIVNAVLSPDGYYALILARDQGNIGVYILDIQSLQFVELELPDGVELSPVSSGIAGRGGRLDWISNDKIMLPCVAGNVVCSLDF